MSFDPISTLEIPQQATELTTEELKQICGGWNCDHNNDNDPDPDRHRRRHRRRRRRHHGRDGGDY